MGAAPPVAGGDVKLKLKKQYGTHDPKFGYVSGHPGDEIELSDENAQRALADFPECFEVVKKKDK